ncbi:unnamed protein product [Calicophoron daubneyi]|uniref:protein xylosyltransferase n=1 Tax=Calicophoron daubneyi TaxID=300641 RepID=A0AAV2TF56_CALDB
MCIRYESIMVPLRLLIIYYVVYVKKVLTGCESFGSEDYGNITDFVGELQQWTWFGRRIMLPSTPDNLSVSDPSKVCHLVWGTKSPSTPLYPTLSTEQLLDAVARAKSLDCKMHLYRAFCNAVLEETGVLRPHCPTKENSSFVPNRVGCFLVDYEEVIRTKLDGLQSADECVRLCQASGEQFAYIISPKFDCVCRGHRPAQNSLVSDSFCSVKCSDPKDQRSSGNDLPCSSRPVAQVFSTGALPPIRSAPEPFAFYKRPLDVKPARIVYLLVWHGRSWPQMKRLFRTIYHFEHYYYVHVDSRSGYLYREALLLSSLYPSNVHVTDRRYAPVWGGTELLTMVFRAMEDLFTRLPHWKWDFLINLSGSDLPVRSHSELVTYLSNNQGKIFLVSAKDRPRYILAQAMDRMFADCDHYVWHLGPRSLPIGLVLDGGSDWMALPREFAEYVTFGNDPVLMAVKKYYRYSLLPVESFFHVVAQNSRFCSSVINHNLRTINWDRPRGCECKHGSSVDWCGCSPVAFRGQDGMQRLCETIGGCHLMPKNTRPIFFARKFDPTVDLGIINFVTTTILGQVPDNHAWNVYRENIYSASVDTNEVPKLWQVCFQALAQRFFHQLPSAVNSHGLLQLSADYRELINVFTLYNFTSDPAFAAGNTSGLRPPQMVLQVPAYFRSQGASLMVHVELLFQPPCFAWSIRGLADDLKFGEIVHLEVATMFDAKEQIFRNYPRLFSVGDTLQLFIIWKGLSSVNDDSLEATAPVNLVLVDPANHTCRFNSVLALRRGKRTQRAFFCFGCFVSVTPLDSIADTTCSNNQPGLWHLVAQTKSQLDIRTSFFLIPAVSKGITSVRSHLFHFLSPWHSLRPSGFCLNLTNKTSAIRSVSRLVLSSPMNCIHSPWSSFNPDPKSELPH